MPLKFSKPVEEFDFANIRKKVYMTKMMIAACALLLCFWMQAEDGQAIMSSNLAKRQRVDDSSEQVFTERCNDTAYMQVSRTGRLRCVTVHRKI